MKKFLSLVLALVMTMSLVTISAGAKDFGDDGDIDYKEAVDVISALGIVDGYSDSSFRPDGSLTRGAAAKIICNLILGPTTASALSATTAPFKDVPTTNVFAGYITYCAQQGIISGYGDGTFRPTGSLTGNAFLKMLLGALGYDSSIEGYTGSNWQVNVTKQAVGIGLNKGNADFVGSKTVTRQEACLYAFNMLKSDMVQYDSKTTVDINGATVTIAGDKAKAVSTANGWVGTNDGNIDRDGVQQFAEKYFDKLTRTRNDSDPFGRPANEWKYRSEVIGLYADDTDLLETYTAKVEKGDLFSLIGSAVVNGIEDGDYDLEVYVDGQAVRTPNVDDYFVRSSSAAAGVSGNGVVTEVYMDDDSNVTIAQINTYLVQATADYNSAKESLNVEVVDVDCDTVPPLNTVIENADVNVSNFKEDDYILVTYSYDTKEIESAELAEVLTAEVSEFTVDDYVIMGGTTYKYNKIVGDDVSTLEFTIGEDAKVVLDSYGYIMYVDEAISSNSYVYIADVGAYSTTGKTAVANAYFPDGTYDEPIIKKVDGKTSVNACQNARGWYTYSADADGRLTLNSVQTPNAEAYGYVNDTLYASGVTVLKNDNVKFLGTATTYSKPSANSGGSTTTITIGNNTSAGLNDIRGDSSTIFVVVDGDGDVTAYTGVANAPDITTSESFTGPIYVGVVYRQSNGYARYVFIDASADEDVIIDDANSAADYLFLLKDTGNRTTSGDDTYYKYKVVYDGVETEKFVESSLVAGQKVGMLFRDVKENAKGYVTKATPFGGDDFAGNNKRDEYTLSAATNDEITYSNDTLTFTVNGAAKDYIIASDCNVTLAFGKDANLDLVNEGDSYTLYQTSARGMAGMLKDYDLSGKVYVAVDDTDSQVATDIYVWIDKAVGTTSGGGSPVSTTAVVLSASQISNASDYDLLSGSIPYYKQSGANVTSLDEKWALLEKAGCTDISISNGAFNYTTPSGQKVSGQAITAVRYYKVTVDGTNYYLKDGDTVKLTGGTVAMKATYFSVNGGAPTTTNNATTGYTVSGADAVITSGYFAVNTNCMNTTVATSGTATDSALFKVNQPTAQVFLQAGGTFKVELEIQTNATTTASTVTFSGAEIETVTITVDPGVAVGTKIPVTLTLADTISSNLDANEIAVTVTNKT